MVFVLSYLSKEATIYGINVTLDAKTPDHSIRVLCLGIFLSFFSSF